MYSGVCNNVCMCLYTYIYAYMCVCVYLYIYMCICACDFREFVIVYDLQSLPQEFVGKQLQGCIAVERARFNGSLCANEWHNFWPNFHFSSHLKEMFYERLLCNKLHRLTLILFRSLTLLHSSSLSYSTANQQANGMIFIFEHSS